MWQSRTVFFYKSTCYIIANMMHEFFDTAVYTHRQTIFLLA